MQHIIISGYKILNLALLESSFERKTNVTFDVDKVNRESETDVEVQKISEEQVLVTETLTFTQTSLEGDLEISAKIKMIGIFEKSGDTELSIDEFAKINAPAIIYPYIREHLSSLTTKAAVGTILLSPYNFQVKKVNEGEEIV
jgi:preprotein translocase subunit SecB